MKTLPEALPDLPPTYSVDVKIDPRTPEGRKAMRLLDVPTVILVAALGLPPKHTRPPTCITRKVRCVSWRPLKG